MNPEKIDRYNPTQSGLLSEPTFVEEDFFLPTEGISVQTVLNEDAVSPFPVSNPNSQSSKSTMKKGSTRLKDAVVFLKPTTGCRDRFILLQKWEGIVTQVLDDSVIARLIDLEKDAPEEEAEIELEEIPIADRELVATGAIFYWSIGYIDSLSGQRTRASTIRFRRLPVWGDNELKNARKNALQTQHIMGWR